MAMMGLGRRFSPGQILLFAVTFSGYVQHVMALAAPSPRTVLVTGGAGYIGSHTCLELLNEEENVYNVVVIDNLENASEESLKRVQALTGCDKERLQFRNCDIRDKEGLKRGKIASKNYSHFVPIETNHRLNPYKFSSSGRIPRNQLLHTLCWSKSSWRIGIKAVALLRLQHWWDSPLARATW